MKRRYESPAWVSDLMDEAGLTATEFRVLAHVCRRAGDGSNGRSCDASIASMAQVCRMKAETVRGALQDLTIAGWLTAEERTGKPTVYTPKFPPWFDVDPSPETGGVETHPSPQTVAHPSPKRGGVPSPQTGVKVIPEVIPSSDTREERDSNSAPRGTALTSASGFVEIQWHQVKALTAEMHAKARHDPESLFGIFPPEEVEEWARDWHLRYELTGGVLDGVRIRKPLVALTAWLRACARRQSKRFKELGRLAP